MPRRKKIVDNPCNVTDNTIFTGDNLDILRGINSNSIDLIYLDPPFNSNRNYSAPIGSEAAGAAFVDTWTLDEEEEQWLEGIQETNPIAFHTISAAGAAHGDDMQAYLTYMYVRLIEMYRVLKSTGSLYLHCDPKASHYLKVLLDGIFGEKNFINEIVWGYGLGGSSKRTFSKKHDVILFYGKSNSYYFDKPLEPATSQRMRGKMKGMTDIWPIPNINNMAKERVGYPTQKPLKLLERIIAASTNLGDIVLDPFCGCATACVAAEKLGRKWIGIDLSKMAYKLVNLRLKRELGFMELGTQYSDKPPVRSGEATVLPTNWRPGLKRELFLKQGGKCANKYCPLPAMTEDCIGIFEVDHVVPKSKGGTYEDTNAQLLCSNCNRVKWNRDMAYLEMRTRTRLNPMF